MSWLINSIPNGLPNFKKEFVINPHIPNIYKYDNLYYQHIIRWLGKRTPSNYHKVNMDDFLQDLIIQDNICKYGDILNKKLRKALNWINKNRYVSLLLYIVKLLHQANTLYTNINKSKISRYTYCHYILTIRAIHSIIRNIEPSYFTSHEWIL